MSAECECPPCPGRGYDGHTMNHCAECCFGTGVEADMDCPQHGVAAQVIPGNLDPWAGPVDPVAYARWVKRHHAEQSTWRAQRDAGSCGCWRNDCGECGAKISDGHRPAPGAQRRWTLGWDADLQDARNRAVAAGHA